MKLIESVVKTRILTGLS